jgi:hypothetical protein
MLALVVAGTVLAAPLVAGRISNCAPSCGAGDACLLQLHKAFQWRNASLPGTGDFPADNTSEYFEFSSACRGAGLTTVRELVDRWVECNESLDAAIHSCRDNYDCRLPGVPVVEPESSGDGSDVVFTVDPVWTRFPGSCGGVGGECPWNNDLNEGGTWHESLQACAEWCENAPDCNGFAISQITARSSLPYRCTFKRRLDCALPDQPGECYPAPKAGAACPVDQCTATLCRFRCYVRDEEQIATIREVASGAPAFLHQHLGFVETSS